MHLMPSDPEHLACIVGFDPGTDTLGVAVITFDVRTLWIEKTTALTLRGSKCRMDPMMVETHSARFARLDALGWNILELLRYHQPIAVASESPFFSSRMPGAFAALVEAVVMIRQAVWMYDPSVGVSLIDPPSVKQAVNAKGNAGKDVIQKAVLAIGELNYEGLLPLGSLDEHSIDAIAVAYSKLIDYRNP